MTLVWMDFHALCLTCATQFDYRFDYNIHGQKLKCNCMITMQDCSYHGAGLASSTQGGILKSAAVQGTAERQIPLGPVVDMDAGC